MSIIRWLHLSDLHILWKDANKEDYKNEIIASLEKEKINFIVITGDFKSIQKDPLAGFTDATSYITSIVQSLKLDVSKKERIFVVPGNHDMNPKQDNDSRTAELQKLLPPEIKPWDTQSAFDETLLAKHAENPQNYVDRLCGEDRGNKEEAQQIINYLPIMSGFSSYNDFVERLIPAYMNDVRPASVHRKVWEDDISCKKVLNIVHLNTAIVSDGGRNHYQAIDLLRAKSLLAKIAKSNDLPTIILAHNTFFDLHPQIQKALKSSLRNANVVAWLCGDAHTFSSNSEIDCSFVNEEDTIEYKIPIFVCGKSSFDSSDTFSDFGYFIYEYDTSKNTLSVKKWGGTVGEGKTLKPITTIKINSIIAHDRVYIGYLSCNPKQRLEEKYHLGHALFIKNIEQKLSNGNTIFILTSSYLLTKSRTLKDMNNDELYVRKMLDKWNDCFKQKVHVVDIKDYLVEDEPQKRNHRLLAYLNRMERLMEQKRFREIHEIASKWKRDSNDTTEEEFEQLKRFFDPGIENCKSYHPTKDQIFAFAYLLHKRPTWYSSSWLVDFIVFWTQDIYSLIAETTGERVYPDKVYIIESDRNSYTWNAFSFCASIFKSELSSERFTQLEIFDSLKDAKMQQPMKSSASNNSGVTTVFLAEANSDNYQNSDFSEEFISHVHEMFHSDENPIEIAKEYYDKLFTQ